MTDVRLSNLQVDRICERLMGATYRGCITKDAFVPSEGAFVINLQSRGQQNYEGQSGGTHWVGVYIKPKCYYYFDSFGFPPPIEVTEQLHNIHGLYNIRELQPVESDLCGFYVIYALKCLQMGGCITKFGDLVDMKGNKPFTNDKNANDKKMMRFRSMLGRHPYPS